MDGNDVVANPELTFNQSGVTLGGPIIKDKLFFFVNAELERRDDPGTDFVADTDGTIVQIGHEEMTAEVLEPLIEELLP